MERGGVAGKRLGFAKPLGPMPCLVEPGSERKVLCVKVILFLFEGMNLGNISDIFDFFCSGTGKGGGGGGVRGRGGGGLRSLLENGAGAFRGEGRRNMIFV